MLSSHLPILPKDLKEFQGKIGALLAQVKWKPAKNLAASAPSQDITATTKLWRPSTVADTGSEDIVSILKIAKTIAEDPVLLPESINHTLRAIRTGASLGLYLARQYGVAAGLRELEDQNRLGRLGPNQQGDFRQKVSTSAAIALFCAASYAVWDLSSYESEKVSGARVEFHGVPEISLLNPQRAMECMLYYLGVYLDPQKSGLVKTDLEMVAMTLHFMGGVIKEVKIRQDSLKFPEFFTKVSYQLTDTDFTVQGFEALRTNGTVSVEFKKVRFDEIVGNRQAKHEANRLAQRLVCYDLKERMNPFVKLGGLQTVRMGFGVPGTGKSLQIAATATLIEEYCKMLDLPFFFTPLPDNIVSTFQGGSAERMVDWMRPLQADDRIVYGSIDDAENTLEERTRQGVSAGVREVIGVFLRYTEGAYAIVRGNTVIEIFTNLPEQIDKAVLSRIQTRFPINGARTTHDFLDQDFLWWKKFEETQPGFVGLAKPRGYEFLTDQRAVRSIAALSASGHVKPADPRIAALYEKLYSECHGRPDHDFFAELFVGVQGIYPNFSSRDLRNIQQAVATRIMDFDLPPEWFEKPDLFFRKDFATKMVMIKDLMRANMGKEVTFVQVRLEETVRYLDSMASIANIDRERQVARLIEDSDIRNEAAARLSKRSAT